MEELVDTCMENSQKPEPLRMLHVVLSLGVAGAEKLAYDMLRFLREKGHVGAVCCLDEVGPLGERLREQGFRVFHRGRRPGIDWKLVFWLRNLIRTERIQVVHAHQYTPYFYAALATLFSRDVRLVYTEHGRLFPDERRWKRFLFDPFFSLATTHLVSIAESTRKAMARYDNFPYARIEVVHNGVPLEMMNPPVDVAAKRRLLGVPGDGPLVGTAARLEGIKNLPMMLRAFQRVAQVHPDARLVIAGDGSERANLESLAGELEILERVHFLGLRYDLPEVYKLYDIFLLSSFTEGISVTLLEAMASGVPAVVTDVGGNPEVVVQGETGYLVPPNDDEAMATRIVELLHDDAGCREMGRKALKRVREHFSFDAMMQRYCAMYRGD